MLSASYEESLKDDDWQAFLDQIRDLMIASGGIAHFAERMGCSRTTLYKTLSAKGNPRLTTLAGILRELGLRISFKRI